MPVIPFEGVSPTIAPDAFIAPTAWVTGKVAIASQVSLFFGAVIRGDIQAVSVGKGTNLQEHVMVHTSHDLPDCIIGEDVTVGHRAIVHGCTVKNNCIIGMGAVLLDGAVIEENCIIGAQALVPMNMKIPAGSLVVGIPARVVRQLSNDEIEGIRRSAAHYREVSRHYAEHFRTSQPS